MTVPVAPLLAPPVASVLVPELETAAEHAGRFPRQGRSAATGQDDRGRADRAGPAPADHFGGIIATPTD